MGKKKRTKNPLPPTKGEYTLVTDPSNLIVFTPVKLGVIDLDAIKSNRPKKAVTKPTKNKIEKHILVRTPPNTNKYEMLFKSKRFCNLYEFLFKKKIVQDEIDVLNLVDNYWRWSSEQRSFFGRFRGISKEFHLFKNFIDNEHYKVQH